MTIETQQTYNPDFSDLNVQFNAARGEGFGADRMTGKYMYWRKPMGDPRVTDEGYVVVGSATPQELVRQLDKGFMPLRNFGEFQLWNPQENWRVSNEPYRRIFQRPGGLQVFPIKQIIEHHWHLLPPYAGIQFPQMAGVVLTDIRCVECRQWFTSQEMLLKHRSVRHAATANNSALGETIARSVAAMSEPMQAALAPMIKAMQEQSAGMVQMMQHLALSQDEQRRLYDLFQQRQSYGGDRGVPPAPVETPADDSVPLAAEAIDVTPPTSGGKAKNGG